jgi:hypothetical protein
MAAQDEQIPEISMDADDLYREENFTDRKVGTIRKMVPVKPDGSDDSSRSVVFIGTTQILTPYGAVPLSFEIDASDLKQACENFPDAAKAAVDRTIEEAKQARHEAASSIIVPEGGGGSGGMPGGGMPGGGMPGGGGFQMP